MNNYALIILATIFSLNASTVVIQKNGSEWQLLKDGTPYYVKGAGGGAYMDKLKANGGNSVRTWSADKNTLDKAQSLGMTVCLGISGNNFSQAKQAVQTYKDHPALLMWGLGNEMESSTSDQVALWKMVDSIARMIKEVDGNHPSITVVADIGGSKIQNLMQYAPNLDALGINTYGGLSSLKSRVVQSGWNKPFFVTEFGPVGWWECSKTPWGLPLEQTSTEKESTYVVNYQKSIQDNPLCLGGYVFLWGNKQEKTHTWFGMFLPDGSPVGTVDGMCYVWTGAYPTDQCPRIKAGKLKVGRDAGFGDGTDRYFRPGTDVRCVVDADDPDGDAVTITWDLRIDVSDNSATGGAYEPPSVAIAGAVLSSSNNTAIIKMPTEAKKYRIFCYVKDPKGNAATVNCPIVVDPNAPVSVQHTAAPFSSSTGLLVNHSVTEKSATLLVNIDKSSMVSLGAYSAKGALVAKIDTGYRIAGPYRYAWNTSQLGSGTYIIKLTTGDKVLSRKIIIQ